MNVKLGRKAIKTDTRTLRLSRYLTPSLPPSPVSVDWTKGITNWGMMLNDKLGDCTIAGCGHAVQVWSANSYQEITVPDSIILSAYESWDGYNPSDPDTDRGGIELDVLAAWRKNGLGPHALYAFADPSVSNLEEIRQSIALFGGVYIGVNLPASAQDQNEWSVSDPSLTGDSAPGSWGGHAVFVCAYDTDSFTCVTWGGLMKMTVGFWKAYVDEAHALLGFDWLSSKGSPSGFDLTQLQTDLAAIR